MSIMKVRKQMQKAANFSASCFRVSTLFEASYVEVLWSFKDSSDLLQKYSKRDKQTDSR